MQLILRYQTLSEDCSLSRGLKETICQEAFYQGVHHVAVLMEFERAIRRKTGQRCKFYIGQILFRLVGHSNKNL